MGSPQSEALWGRGGATKRNLNAAHSSFDLSAVCDDGGTPPKTFDEPAGDKALLHSVLDYAS